MSKDLITSAVDRQNVLNNPYALAEIGRTASIPGDPFEGTRASLKKQAVVFFVVINKTDDNYIERHSHDLIATHLANETDDDLRLRLLKVISGIGAL